MQELSLHSIKFKDLLSTTSPEDKEYLTLAYILSEHLNDINKGDCPYTII